MGGNCSRQYPEMQPVNQDDKINETKEIPKACGVAGSVKNYIQKYIPDNGEYRYSGEGSGCFYCSLMAGIEISCNAGCDGVKCCAVAGKKGTYTRHSYLADKLKCCLKKDDGNWIIDNKTCHPDYRGNLGKDCVNVIKNHCFENINNIFNDSVCKNYCKDKDCNKEISDFCNREDLNKHKTCLTWCSNNKGKCDESFTNFCKQNINDDRCACINSDVNKINSLKKYNPLCVDKNCIAKNAYTTQNMLDGVKGGCNIVDCTVQNNLSDIEGNVDLNNLKLDANCGNKDNSDDDNIFDYLPKSEKLIEYIPENEYVTKDTIYYYISGAIAAIILILLGVYYYFF